MSKSNLQTNLEYAVARSLLAIFGWLPLRLFLSVGSRMGRAAYFFSGRLRRTGQLNLELAFPESTEQERRRLLRGFFENLGRLLGVFTRVRSSDPQALQSLMQFEVMDI